MSHQTVSNVLNDHPSVRPATRERVMRSVRALDYQPNHAAKALREARVTTVCCAFHGHNAFDLTDPYLNAILAAFVAEANTHGYSVVMAFMSDGDPQGYAQLRRNFRQHLFDGMVVVSTTMTRERLAEFKDWGIQTVLLDHALPNAGVCNVTAHYADGMEQLVRHHVRQGRRRLALILPERDTGSTSHLRKQGFEAEVARQGAAHRIVTGDWSYESGIQAMHDLWASGFHPDAVLAANDRMAAGALRGAHELGLRVPQDLAITGFDDRDLALFTTPRLTTVRVPLGDMARHAVRALLKQMDAGQPQESVEFPVSLVVRESA